MFCQKCGAEIDDEAAFCQRCGNATNKNIIENTTANDENESKAIIGFVMGLFLGLIGLIIGLCLYKDGTLSRKTFLKGWAWTFATVCIISFLVTFAISLQIHNTSVY